MILLAVTAILWLAGFGLIARLRSGTVQGAGFEAASVSVIIPARNEERNLPALIDSLASQSVRPGEILVVDDGSTDRTAEVARKGGARVLASPSLPEGWRGKTWACHTGAQAARGALLLFVDADTWFEPEGFRRLLEAYPGGAFSVGPFHAVRRPYEDLSLFFNVCMTVGTGPARLFGPVLLIGRAEYERGGGHEAVRDRILENLALSAHLRRAGVPVRSVIGRGLLAFRMYPGGLRELVQGWTKAFAAGAGQTERGVMGLVVVWMNALMLSWLGGWFTFPLMPWLGMYLLCVAQVAWISRKIGAFRWYSVLLFPVPLLFFFLVFARSALSSGRTVIWKGREIRAD